MEAIVLIGIQGAGKSTFYRERFFETHVRISLDLFATRQREQAFLRTCLANGQCFVIDNTNIRIEDRAGYISAARGAGFRIAGYFFPTALRTALGRNAHRTGKVVVPTPGVIRAFKRLEPPTPVEGFDELYVVATGANNEFQVSPWKP